MGPKVILERTRRLIRAHAGDDPDRWWYANRFVFARLQLDERKTKTGIKQKLISSGQPCHACRGAFASRKGIHLHRLDGAKGYTEGNCVLMHGPCHQKWHAEHAADADSTDPIAGQSPTLTKQSKRYDGTLFTYWWDITPNLAKQLDAYEVVEFECRDTGERCAVSASRLIQFLTSERQTRRGEGNWGIRVLTDRPDELAFEPPTGSDEWLFLPVTWLEDEKED